MGIFEYEMKMKEQYMKSKHVEPHNVGFLLHQGFSSTYPCAEISDCPGFTRHYRDRGSGIDEDKLFYSINESSGSARARYIRNEKERTMQEECDKIHSYFLHSTIQFGWNHKENDQEINKHLDGITGNAQGRSFSTKSGSPDHDGTANWDRKKELKELQHQKKKQGKNEKT